MRVIESLPQPALDEYWHGSRTESGGLYESDGSVALVKSECHNFDPIEAAKRIGDVGEGAIRRLIESIAHDELISVNMMGWIDTIEDGVDVSGCCRRIACFMAADDSCIFVSAAKFAMILKMIGDSENLTFKVKKSTDFNMIVFYKNDHVAALLVGLNCTSEVQGKLSRYVLSKPSSPFDTVKAIVGGDDSTEIVIHISVLEGIKDDFNSKLQSCYEALIRDLRDIPEENKVDYKKIMILVNSYVDGVNMAMNAFKTKTELNTPVLSDCIKNMRTEVDQTLFDTRCLDLDS